MLLAEVLFACVAGVAAVALVIATAPVWTAVASRISRWMVNLFTRAGHTVDESIYGNGSQQEEDEEKL